MLTSSGDSKLYSASGRVQLKTMGELWSKCVEIMILALENSIQVTVYFLIYENVCLF